MKNFNLFLLVVGLLLCSSYSSVGFGLVGPFTTSAFKCLLSSVPDAAPFVIVRAYQNSHSPPGIDPNALQTLNNALTAGYSAGIYVELCRGIDAASQLKLINTEIILPMITNAKFFPFIYLKVVPSSNPDCSWEGYTPSDNCKYLVGVANVIYPLGNQYLTPSIFSTSSIFQRFFGGYCDGFARNQYSFVNYVKYDSTGHVISTQSTNDYVPFGGWTSAQIKLKQIGGSVQVPLLCGSTAWHALVEQFYIAS